MGALHISPLSRSIFVQKQFGRKDVYRPTASTRRLRRRDLYRFWLNKVHAIPELATFGFTAHLKSSKIGALIEEGSYLWYRFRIRFSAETHERSTTVMIAPPIGRHRAVITCPVDAAPPKRVGKPRDLKCGSCGA